MKSSEEWPWTRTAVSMAWALAFGVFAWRVAPGVAGIGVSLVEMAREMRRDCILPGTIEPCGKGKRGR